MEPTLLPKPLNDLFTFCKQVGLMAEDSRRKQPADSFFARWSLPGVTPRGWPVRPR
jgi:hypothetical protein